MPLTQEQQEKIAERPRSKGADKCAACGFAGGMRYGDIVILHRAQALIEEPTAASNISVVPISCPNCGHTILFEMGALSLLERP
jgi:predicted RNA-binding Zn-ribbon protein involved in translation (DUF1610 family)